MCTVAAPHCSAAAVIYWVLGVPLSFWLWYKRIYVAARDEGTVGYFWFFLFFTVHIAFCIWAAIGVCRCRR